MRRLVARRDASLHAQIIASWPLRTANGDFVRAGSALVRAGRRLLAVQDDAWQAWWIEPRTHRLRPLVLAGSGARKPKSRKPDLEAAFAARGSLWLLGSGAKPPRRRIARIILEPRARHAVHDAAPLYAALETALAMPPNIEGAVAVGERLRLFHRGPGRARQANAIVEVAFDVLEGGAARVKSVQDCNLGRVGQLHLGFTDAVGLGRDRVLYLAVAEDTPDGIADGPIAGAAIGIIENGAGRWTLLREADGSPSRRKFEGIALGTDRKRGYLLTDPDDPRKPAELCRVKLHGFG